MKSELIKKEILKIIKKIKHTSKISIKSNLIKDGFLDSFDIIVLVSEIEKKFKIKVSGEKINLKNFSKIDQIYNLVKNASKF